MMSVVVVVVVRKLEDAVYLIYPKEWSIVFRYSQNTACASVFG